MPSNSLKNTPDFKIRESRRANQPNGAISISEDILLDGWLELTRHTTIDSKLNNTLINNGGESILLMINNEVVCYGMFDGADYTMTLYQDFDNSDLIKYLFKESPAFFTEAELVELKLKYG